MPSQSRFARQLPRWGSWRSNATPERAITTQPPDAVVMLHRAAACQKEDFALLGMEVPGGCQDKKRVLEENVKIKPPQQGG